MADDDVRHRVPPFEERRKMQRDIYAGLRALSKDKSDEATKSWEKYRNDHKEGYVFYSEMVEVTTGIAATAADFGLPIKNLLEHIVNDVPDDRRPAFRDAVDLINAVNEERSPEEQSRSFATYEEYRAFFVALWNIAVYLVRQIARRHQTSEDEIYDAIEHDYR
jgi:hypothetical protein